MSSVSARLKLWSLLVLAGAVLAGVALGAEGLLGNLLAELAGVAAGVLVAVGLFPVFEKRVRGQRWERVRKTTYRAIAAHLCDVAVDVMSAFEAASPASLDLLISGRHRPSREAAAALRGLAGQLTAPAAESGGGPSDRIACDSYAAIKWDLQQIREILIPRVLQSSDDDDVIDALVEFEQSTRELENATLIHKRLSAGPCALRLAELMEQAATVYATLLDRW